MVRHSSWGPGGICPYFSAIRTTFDSAYTMGEFAVIPGISLYRISGASPQCLWGFVKCQNTPTASITPNVAAN